MRPDERELTEGERYLLAHVSDIAAGEDQTPQSVLDGAKALHDWGRVDRMLAELTSDVVTTRGDGAAYAFTYGAVTMRAEVEPAGYRRRRLILVAHDDSVPAGAEEISVQFPDGTTLGVAADRFGEHITQVPSGSVRMIALFDSGTVTSPWFTV